MTKSLPGYCWIWFWPRRPPSRGLPAGQPRRGRRAGQGTSRSEAAARTTPAARPSRRRPACLAAGRPPRPPGRRGWPRRDRAGTAVPGYRTAVLAVSPGFLLQVRLARGVPEQRGLATARGAHHRKGSGPLAAEEVLQGTPADALAGDAGQDVRANLLGRPRDKLDADENRIELRRERPDRSQVLVVDEPDGSKDVLAIPAREARLLAPEQEIDPVSGRRLPFLGKPLPDPGEKREDRNRGLVRHHDRNRQHRMAANKLLAQPASHHRGNRDGHQQRHESRLLRCHQPGSPRQIASGITIYRQTALRRASSKIAPTSAETGKAQHAHYESIPGGRQPISQSPVQERLPKP